MPPNPKKKPTTAVEKWNHAMREAAVPDGPDVSEMTAAEVEKELALAEADLGAIKAMAEATYERAQAKLGGSPSKKK